MKKFILIIFIAVLTASCANFGRDYAYTNSDNVSVEKIDTAKVTRFMYQNAVIFNYNKDDFSNDTWVVSRIGVPKYRNRNGVYTYFSLYNGLVPTNFRFVFQYYDGDWLFIRQLRFNVDGEVFIVDCDCSRDNADGKIWEWFDTSVGPGYPITEELVSAIAKANKVKVKIIGNNYYTIKDLSLKEIDGIKYTYIFYKELGGVF